MSTQKSTQNVEYFFEYFFENFFENFFETFTMIKPTSVMEVICVMWVMEVMWGTVAQVEASPSEFRSPSVRCPLASL